MWPEEQTFKILIPDAPMVKPIGRKVISQKLLKENKEFKSRKRYLKYW